MSAFQTLIAGAFVIGVSTVAIDGLDKLFDVNGSPIQVHSVRYEDGIIYQERTITVDNNSETFALFWVAKLVDESGNVVRHCTGNGAWAYSVGRAEIPIPLDEWVGRLGVCTPDKLQPGTYTPVGIWMWGENQVEHRGEPFTISEGLQ